MIRAIRLELAKPKDERWDVIGPLMRTLSKATPKLLTAAHDARIAIEVVGRESVKTKIAPDAKAASGDGLAYQAVLRSIERLREWGAKKNHPFANLEVPGGMSSAIARAASQAYARRDQGRQHFTSERILVRASETLLACDEQGTLLSVKLRAAGAVRFVVRHSWGTHRETLDAIVSKKLSHGDCKIQWDERREKWYALISYEAPAAEVVPIDMTKVLAVHRGVRNALYILSSTGAKAPPFHGNKFVAQRRALQARMHEAKRTSDAERGPGAKGHGRERRYESYDALEGKLARATHTFCQQAAAFVASTAKSMGCGVVLIEDYGGIAPNTDPHLRRVLERFPLYELKQSIGHRTESDGLTLQETTAAYISTTCPRCGEADAAAHNKRTGIFHCRACIFERPADWVATYWMLKQGGADMTVWDKRLERERQLADTARQEKEKPGDEEDDVRGAGKRVQEAPRKKRARGGGVLRVPAGGRAET